MRRLYLIIIIAAVALIGLSFGVFEYTSTPSFCKSCHNMKPYYESWKASKHKEVNCLKCHFEPGFGSYIKGKISTGLTDVVNYATGTYKKRKPHAEIRDESCLREGCHGREALETKRIQFKGITFIHQPHFTRSDSGLRLRCTSCHSHTAQKAHFSVEERTCFLCHFPKGEVKEPVSACTSCHGEPKGIVKVGGEEIKHEELLSSGASCTQCHTSIVEGDGDVPDESCTSCHSEPETVGRYGEVDLIHKDHLSYGVECSRCHLDIKHELPSPHKPPTAACNSCHAGSHLGQAATLKGRMLQLHPTCQNCHDLEKQGREVNCRPCHREEILTLVPIWRDEIMRSRAELLSAIERLGTVKEKDIRTLIQETRLSVKKLKEDELIHNPRLASSEITSAYERIQSVYSAGGKEFKSKHLESLKLSSKSPCSPCHFGMETKRIRFGGKGFVHAPHIVDAEMECSDCHEETPELDRSHGDLTIEPSECETCH